MHWTHEVVCPTCSGNVAMRINRIGFWQKHVLARFGLYPWKCGACGSSFVYRHRGHNNRLSSQDRVAGASRNRS